ncbi:hypothetical protein BGZ52_009380, partial [Haplosporangium bisporale]
SSKHQILAPKAPSPPSPQSHFQSQNLITPGSVFVFDETEAKICRWTDGRIWSPSRICGNFLVYHELYRKLPSQKYSARDKAGVRNGYGLKDKALRRKVEQDGLVVLGSRKGTFVLKKDGLIKKTICVKGISLPPPEKMKGGPLVVEMTTTAPSKMGRGRAAKAVESRVSGLNFTGTQHLVCYEQAGAMAGLYRPRDYVELREMSLSKTFITSQKFRDPVQVRPLPAGQKPVEPSDEYIRQTRIVEVRTSPKATLPSTEPNVARSAPITTRKESGSATRRGGKRGIESKLRTVLNHPYTTRSQDRQLREVLEENQFLESSDTESKSASPLLADIDQTNDDHADRITETIKRDPNDPDNSPLRLEPLAQEQVCESNRREYDGTMEAPSGQTSRNTKRHGQVRAQDRDTSERTLNREQDYERTFRSSDNDATECSSSNSSPVTITNGCSTEGYGPRPNEYQMTPQQVLHCQLQYRLRLHQMEEQRWIESHKRRRYVTSDEGSVGYHHPNAISSPPVGGASETKSKGTVSGDEEDEGVRSSWTTGVDFDSEASKLKGEQRSFGDAQLLQEQMPDSGPADSAHVIEWVDSDDGKETTVRHAISPIDGADIASESGSHQPSSRAQVWTPSNVSKVSDYSEQEQPIGRAHQWSSSPFGPKSACKRRRRSSSGEYLASADYEGFESPTVDNVAKDCRETSLNYTPTRYDSSQPIQIMSHVHINHRRRPSITNESTKPAEDITVTNLGTNEYLLYSHHQPATFEVVLEDTVVSHDEPPSAHLISEEDPFFSDLRARGIGGRSCLAVHASSSPAEPSSADDHGRDEPRDRSVQL